MAYDGNIVASMYVARKYSNISGAQGGPSRGLHLQVSRTKVGWPTMSPDLPEIFDCNVLCSRNGTAAEVITLLRAAFGSHSHIRSVFKIGLEHGKHPFLLRKILWENIIHYIFLASESSENKNK